MYKLVTIVVLGLVLAVGIGQSGKNSRSYVAGRFLLELDRVPVGFLAGVEGGSCYSDVIEEEVGADGVARKHISGVKFEDITVTCSAGMSPAFYDWIQSSIAHKPLRKSGAIIAADFNYNEKSRREFTNALITEIAFPAMDGASKDAAYMKLKVSPEFVRTVPGSGKEVQGAALKQKKWLTSNFQFTLGNLPASRVNKVEALTIKQKVVQDPRGGLVPGKLEYPNLTVYIPEPDAPKWYDWHDDFVIKGNNGQDAEQGGTLTYIDADLRTTLMTLGFSGVGMFKIAPDKMEAGAEQIRRVKVEMYVEEMSFKGGSAAQ